MALGARRRFLRRGDVTAVCTILHILPLAAAFGGIGGTEILLASHDMQTENLVLLQRAAGIFHRLAISVFKRAGRLHDEDRSIGIGQLRGLRDRRGGCVAVNGHELLPFFAIDGSENLEALCIVLRETHAVFGGSRRVGIPRTDWLAHRGGFRGRNGAMPGHHRAEVAEVVWPHVGLAQIDFSDGDRAPLRGLGYRFAGLIENRRNHPAVLRFHESAADDVNVVFARASLGQQRIAAINRPRNHLGPAVRQLAGDFGEKAIVANHQADFAELRVEHRIVPARRDALLDLTVRQAHLAILADQPAIRAEKNGRVVNQMPVPFIEAQHNVQVMFPGELPKVSGRWSGNDFGRFVRLLLHAHRGDRFPEHD